MKKVQFFLLVEAFIFTLALFDILASETARILLLLAALLLVIWYFTSRKVNSLLITSANILILLVFVLNPFFIVGVLIALLYVVVNFFARNEKKNQYTHIIMDEETVSVDRKKNKWLGNQIHTRDHYGFEDINIIRLFGNDVVDLDETVLVGRDNIVMVRKVFGRTKIVVPIDVEVSLSATSLYGQVRFLGLSEWDLRNESFSISSSHYKESHKRVKIVNSSLFGDVEVVRV